jgi:hypothetical protein
MLQTYTARDHQQQIWTRGRGGAGKREGRGGRKLGKYVLVCIF